MPLPIRGGGIIRSFHGTHNVVYGGVLQTMWEELAGQVVHHAYLKTLYTWSWSHVEDEAARRALGVTLR